MGLIQTTKFIAAPSCSSRGKGSGFCFFILFYVQFWPLQKAESRGKRKSTWGSGSSCSVTSCRVQQWKVRRWAGAICGCCCVKNPRNFLPCIFTTNLWLVRIYWLFHRWLCKLTKTSSLSLADLHWFYWNLEVFTSQQTEKDWNQQVSGATMGWAEETCLDVKYQHKGTQVPWMDEAAGPYCGSQHVWTLPIVGELRWLLPVSKEQHLHCSLLLLWGLRRRRRTHAEPGFFMRQQLCLVWWHFSAGTTPPAEGIHLCVATAEVKQLPHDTLYTHCSHNRMAA